MSVRGPANTDDVLNPYDEVELKIGSDEDPRMLRARATKVMPDGIIVALPEDAQDLAASTESYAVQVTRPGKDAVFVLETVREVIAEVTTTSVIFLKPQGEWKRVQRRWDVRWRISLEARMRVAPPGGERTTLAVTVLDISAGGLLVQSKQSAEPGDLVTAIFQLPGESTPMQTAAQVVRCVPLDDEKLKVFRIGLRFVELPEKDRDHIVRFIFQEQAKARRLGADRPRFR